MQGEKKMAKPTIEQMSELHHQIESGRISREALQVFLRNPGQFADRSFKVVVNYFIDLPEMIAAGHYDSVDEEITDEICPVCDEDKPTREALFSQFDIDGEGKAERKLILVYPGPNKMVKTDEVLAEMDHRGLRPARIEELLALGAKFPEEQKKFAIVALGSCRGKPDISSKFACLCGDGEGKRFLFLHSGCGGWDQEERFLAVPKKTLRLCEVWPSG
jgi:hypothetical protein